jgi:hypothetical protein
VLLNQGSLTFTQASYIGGFGSVNLTLADHDGDGDLDLYSATQGSSVTGDVSYFVNHGDGTFAAVVIIESSLQPQDIAVADFNRDGRVDIAVPNRGSSTGVIHPQGVAAAFETPPTYPTFSAPDTVVTADFDGDGDIDVASSVPSSHVIDVKFNDGTGALTSVATIPSPGQPTSVWAADLNGDGLPDLVWTASSFPPNFGVALDQGAGIRLRGRMLARPGDDRGRRQRRRPGFDRGGRGFVVRRAVGHRGVDQPQRRHGHLCGGYPRRHDDLPTDHGPGQRHERRRDHGPVRDVERRLAQR